MPAKTLADLAYRIKHAGEQAAIQGVESGVYTVVEMPASAEMLTALAEAQTVCDHGLSSFRDPALCPSCKGSGTTPRFPMLREPCSCITSADASGVCDTCLRLGGHPSDCEVCQGRGWMPIQHDVVERVIQALFEFLDDVSFHLFLERLLRYVRERRDALSATLAAAVLTVAE